MRYSLSTSPDRHGFSRTKLLTFTAAVALTIARWLPSEKALWGNQASKSNGAEVQKQNDFPETLADIFLVEKYPLHIQNFDGNSDRDRAQFEHYLSQLSAEAQTIFLKSPFYKEMQGGSVSWGRVCSALSAHECIIQLADAFPIVKPTLGKTWDNFQNGNYDTPVENMSWQTQDIVIANYGYDAMTQIMWPLYRISIQRIDGALAKAWKH